MKRAGRNIQTLFLRCLVGAVFFLSACSKPELIVWSAYPELEDCFAGPAAAYKKISLRYRPLEPVTETADFTDLESGFFVLDAAGLDRLIDAGLALELTERTAETPEGGAPALPLSGAGPRYYSGGRPYGFFVNAGTGALCYDPALTEKYLGVSEAAAVQKRLEDLNAFIAAADLISRRSAGAYAILPRVEELRPLFSDAPEKRGIDKAAAERWFADTAELFRDRRWEGLEDEAGNLRRTVFFFLPAGGFFAVPAAPAPDGSAGTVPSGADWRVISGPGGASGGVWLALHRDLFAGKKRRVERIREYLGLLLESLNQP